MIWHWFLHFTGAYDNTSVAYNLWSGFGGDVGEVTIIGGLIAIYRKNKCHEPRCPRLSKHHVDGTPYIVCRKHHPTVPTKAVRGEISRAHDQAQRIAAALNHKPAVVPEPAPRGRKR